jgi:hypothetical protein
MHHAVHPPLCRCLSGAVDVSQDKHVQATIPALFKGSGLIVSYWLLRCGQGWPDDCRGYPYLTHSIVGLPIRFTDHGMISVVRGSDGCC